MKRSYHIINKLLRTFLLLGIFLGGLQLQAQNQEASEKDTREVRNMFNSNWLLDNQTAIVPIKGTFEFDIQHRFGTVDRGYKDFFGLYAPSNIRLGFSYVPVKHLQVGFGFTKQNLLWDANIKYNILHQGRKGGSPINLTYFGNIAIDTRGKDLFFHQSDRLSYFHQLMVARKVTKDFSVQVSGSLSHFNAVEAFINTDKEITGKMKNDHLAVAVLGRYKITGGLAVLANYDQPITKHLTNNPHPNLSLGVEMTTSSHAFQVFVGNYRSLVPQYNNVFNKNAYEEGEFMIGFNISRLANW